MNYPNRIKGWFRLSYQLIITRFKIFNLSSRTVRDKALLTLTTNQKKKLLATNVHKVSLSAFSTCKGSPEVRLRPNFNEAPADI